jgi:predicted nuclease with TOPRIM domain
MKFEEYRDQKESLEEEIENLRWDIEERTSRLSRLEIELDFLLDRMEFPSHKK